MGPIFSVPWVSHLTRVYCIQKQLWTIIRKILKCVFTDQNGMNRFGKKNDYSLSDQLTDWLTDGTEGISKDPFFSKGRGIKNVIFCPNLPHLPKFWKQWKLVLISSALTKRQTYCNNSHKILRKKTPFCAILALFTQTFNKASFN